MPWNAALKSVLPELREPGVARVGVQAQLQVVVIKRQHLRRLQFDSDASICFGFITFNDFISVCPAVTEKRQKYTYYTKTESLFWKSNQPKAGWHPWKKVFNGESIDVKFRQRKQSDSDL